MVSSRCRAGRRPRAERPRLNVLERPGGAARRGISGRRIGRGAAPPRGCVSRRPVRRWRRRHRRRCSPRLCGRLSPRPTSSLRLSSGPLKPSRRCRQPGERRPRLRSPPSQPCSESVPFYGADSQVPTFVRCKTAVAVSMGKRPVSRRLGAARGLEGRMAVADGGARQWEEGIRLRPDHGGPRRSRPAHPRAWPCAPTDLPALAGPG